MRSRPVPRIRLKRFAALSAALLTITTSTGFLAAEAYAAPVTPSTLISLSGSVTDARAEHVSAGVITAPASTPPIEGAQIRVNGRKVATSDATGAFSFAYQDPGGRAVTVTISAPGYGLYQLHDVTPSHSGDLLTAQLTSAAQSIDAQADPGQAPSNRAPSVRARESTPAATSNCGGYSSNTTPPSTILVLEYSEHTSSGAPVAGTETGVFSVPFETYVEDVLPNEWISSWDADSLEAGAMAVKTYGWYWVNNWRGGSYDGACYNVDDSIDYQRYIPGQSAASTDDAVAATWSSVMTESGAIFEASFQATLTGSTSEACGAGLSSYPNTLSQWGSENCAEAGDSWQTILDTYYPSAAITSPTPGSGSPVSIDAAGSDVAFINTSGDVVHDWGTSSGWAGPAAIGGTARADSPVVENAAGTLVVFINTSGQVVNDWADPTTGWHGPAAIGGTAKAGSSLAMNAAGNDVSFINTSGDVVHDWGTSSGWAGPAAIGGTARAGSSLAEDDAGDTVYFINTSDQVVDDWADPTTGWHGPAAIGGTAEAGSPLATDDSGRDVVFLNGSGQVVNDWGTTSGWNGPAAIGGTAGAGSGIAESGGGGDAVFFNAAGQVVNDWGTSSGWNGPAAIGGTARAGSGIAESDSGGTVVFVDASGQVVNDWGTSSGWNGPAAIGGTSR
jgi:hypothetical protein